MESCHAISVDLLRHLGGEGTPIVEDRTETCNNCHNVPFDGVYHPYRINVSPTEPTSPGVIDLDQACGRCHGGDTGNPAVGGAPFIRKAQLAVVADGMHAYARIPNQIGFTYAAGGSDTLTVTVAATVDCAGLCPDLAYEWDWGDGTTTPAAEPGPEFNTDPRAVHVYDSGGLKTITLTVYLAQDIEYNNVVGMASRDVRLGTPDLPPVVSGTCNWNANTWTMTVADDSHDDGADADTVVGDGDSTTQVVLDWGDGSLRSIGRAGETFAHTYLRKGTWTVTHRAIDRKLQSSERNCGPVSPGYFTISGQVVESDGVTPVRSARVVLRNGFLTKRAYTSSQGQFSAGGLKPGVYTVTVSKTNHTFAIPAASVNVGPSSTGNKITAVSP